MDSAGPLSSEDRAALAAWADDGDGPDGFAERVVVAFLAERDGRDHDEPSRAANARGEHHAAEPRTTLGGTRVLRVVGLVAAVAAAAAVMLMVRVLPRASEGDELAEARAGDCGGVEPSLGEHACGLAEAQAQPELGHDEPSVAGQRAPELAVLGAHAGAVLANHCMPCHDSTDPDAKLGALEVFDLDQSHWWITMSDAQLRDARTRVQENEAATQHERRHVTAFVEAELRRRAHSG
jgi:hypothetical protein